MQFKNTWKRSIIY